MVLARTWQMVAMALVGVWQMYNRNMAEVWQTEKGSSRSAELQGSDEKKATDDW